MGAERRNFDRVQFGRGSARQPFRAGPEEELAFVRLTYPDQALPLFAKRLPGIMARLAEERRTFEEE